MLFSLFVKVAQVKRSEGKGKGMDTCYSATWVRLVTSALNIFIHHARMVGEIKERKNNEQTVIWPNYLN